MNRLEVFSTIAVQGALEVLLHIRACTGRASKGADPCLRPRPAAEVYRAKGLDPAWGR